MLIDLKILMFLQPFLTFFIIRFNLLFRPLSLIWLIWVTFGLLLARNSGSVKIVSVCGCTDKTFINLWLLVAHFYTTSVVSCEATKSRESYGITGFEYCSLSILRLASLDNRATTAYDGQSRIRVFAGRIDRLSRIRVFAGRIDRLGIDLETGMLRAGFRGAN